MNTRPVARFIAGLSVSRFTPPNSAMKRRSGTSSVLPGRATRRHNAAFSAQATLRYDRNATRPSDFLLDTDVTGDINPLVLQDSDTQHGIPVVEGVKLGVAHILTPHGALLRCPDISEHGVNDRSKEYIDEITERVNRIVRAYSEKFPEYKWASSRAVRDILTCKVDIVATHEKVHKEADDAVLFSFDIGHSNPACRYEEVPTKNYITSIGEDASKIVGALPSTVSVLRFPPESSVDSSAYIDMYVNMSIMALDKKHGNYRTTPIAWFSKDAWHRNMHDKWFDDVGIPNCISAIICDYVSDSPIDTLYTLESQSLTAAVYPQYSRYRGARFTRSRDLIDTRNVYVFRAINGGDTYRLYHRGGGGRIDAVYRAAYKRLLNRPRVSGDSFISSYGNVSLLASLISADSLICIDDVMRERPWEIRLTPGNLSDIARKTLGGLGTTSMISYERIDFCMSQLSIRSASELRELVASLQPTEPPLEVLVNLRGWVLYYKMTHLERLSVNAPLFKRRSRR